MSAHRYHVLVLMPFARAYDGLFDFIKAAAARADAEAQRVDKEHFEGEIMAQLVGDIESADAIVAVLTGKNPNVYFEVGFAYALGKHLVLLTADKKLPFDVAGIKAIPYRASRQQPSAVADAEQVGTEITEQLEHLLRLPPVGYFQEYRRAAREATSAAGELAPFFVPVATQFFDEWSDFVANLVGGGVATAGPLRLKITRQLVRRTGVYRVVERMVGKPTSLESDDWLAFYGEVGGDEHIQKVWILCVDEAELLRGKEDVLASCAFRQSKGFETRYCSPEKLRRARGVLPPYDAIEDYGDYAKFLVLPDKTYASGQTLNVLPTVFRRTNAAHRSLMDTLVSCSVRMDDAWLQWLRDTPAPPVPALAGSG